MKLPKIKQCNVFVIDAGLAGILAAIEIDSASVMLSSSTNIFSGSSIYPGIWGLGLIGPEYEDDKKI